MPSSLPLQPTLWRSCRVLANRTRLRILHWLAQHPEQTVSAVSAQLRLPLPVASQYLRALEARGFLTVRRQSRWVRYAPANPDTSLAVKPLLAALRIAFQRKAVRLDNFFKLSTAFSHPRRIAVYQALQGGGRTIAELQAITQISRLALHRHLAKLKARGFVAVGAHKYTQALPRDEFGRALALLANHDGAPIL